MLENKLLKIVETKLRKDNLPISVKFWNGAIVAGTNPDIELTINTPKAMRIFTNPTLSTLAESYVHQEIDLKGEIRRIVSVLSDAFNHYEPGWLARIGRFAHSKELDKKSIAHHYDVSNEFYSLWLDQNRVYSCAYYNTMEDSLDLAQEQKLDHICKKLNLKPNESLLDIGCGWGALIFWAAEKYGVRSTGITLSENQYSYVKEEIKRRGLSGLVDVRIQDYRDIPAKEMFDKIVSVGMFEHVGINMLPTYFKTIYDHLKPAGIVLNHGITSARFDGGHSSSGGDFIDKYVFPNGELSHISHVVEKMSKEGLEVLDTESLRRHYAQTLWNWVKNLEKEQEKARSFVGEDKFRIWYAYMSGCAYAFEQNWINLYQIVAAKPKSGNIDYPLTRQHVYR
ncbi:MAG TPA: cyclopropane-fatty-acyl-phospholipid synthase family protein [Ignavibacteriaceae bacterium]